MLGFPVIIWLNSGCRNETFTREGSYLGSTYFPVPSSPQQFRILMCMGDFKFLIGWSQPGVIGYTSIHHPLEYSFVSDPRFFPILLFESPSYESFVLSVLGQGCFCYFLTSVFRRTSQKNGKGRIETDLLWPVNRMKRGDVILPWFEFRLQVS